MLSLKSTTKTVIFIGSGGVGKTTTAAAFALGKAMEGARVLILTIDPSVRLAEVLNFKADGQIHDLTFPKMKGSFKAMTIDHEKSFLHFLNQSKDSLVTEKIKSNKLFKQLSTKLSGSQDFTALYNLYLHTQSEDFDYVILDTPPAQHVIQFLSSPEKLANLFDEKISVWFKNFSDSDKNSFLSKVLSRGIQQVLNILKQLTGSEFMDELSAFFKAITTKQDAIRSTISSCQKILTSKNTEFILITRFGHDQILSAKELSKKIYSNGYNVSNVIINQYPAWIHEACNPKNSLVFAIRQGYLQTESFLVEDLKKFHKNLTLYKCPIISEDMKDETYLLKIYQLTHPVD